MEKVNQRLIKVQNSSPTGNKPTPLTLSEILIKWRCMRWELPGKLVDLKFAQSGERFKLSVEDHVQPLSSQFSIQPQEFVIPSQKIGEFVITFQSPEVGSFVGELIGEALVPPVSKTKAPVDFTSCVFPPLKLQLTAETVKPQ